MTPDESADRILDAPGVEFEPLRMQKAGAGLKRDEGRQRRKLWLLRDLRLSAERVGDPPARRTSDKPATIWKVPGLGQRLHREPRRRSRRPGRRTENRLSLRGWPTAAVRATVEDGTRP